MVRVVRHVGWPIEVVRQLETSRFTELASRAALEFRPWNGRSDYDALVTVVGAPLVDRASRQAALRLAPEVRLSATIASSFVDARRFGKFCACLGSSLESPTEKPSGDHFRVEYPLVRCVTDWLVYSGNRPLVLRHESGITLFISKNLWCSASRPLDSIAALAADSWDQERDKDVSESDRDWGWRFSVECLFALIALRKRASGPSSEGAFKPRLTDVPDLVTGIGQPGLLRAAVRWLRPSSLADVSSLIPEVSSEAIACLLQAGSWSGLACRVLFYDGAGRLVTGAEETPTTSNPAPVTVGPALSALGRMLRLWPAKFSSDEGPRLEVIPMPGEEKIVICGDYASGKTTALRTLLEASAMTMDVENEAASERQIKTTTTVGFDFGCLALGSERLFLYAVPGQERFRMVAGNLLEGSQGAIILLNGADPHVTASLRAWLSLIKEIAPHLPIVAAINRIQPDTPSLNHFRDVIREVRPGNFAVSTADPRRQFDMMGCLRLLVLLGHEGTLRPGAR
jgi:signal recognition particle receptor subunit beta